MAGLGRGERDFHGLPVAHFADEDHLGRLAQGGAQPVWVRVEVGAKLPLIERAQAVLMHELDRILNVTT